jgi:hypothetical protein
MAPLWGVPAIPRPLGVVVYHEPLKRGKYKSSTSCFVYFHRSRKHKVWFENANRFEAELQGEQKLEAVLQIDQDILVPVRGRIGEA